jgi:hypothetical protein
MIVHVGAYLARTLRLGPADWRRHADVLVAGAGTRRASVSGALLAGVILALATYPAQQRWLSHRSEHRSAAPTPDVSSAEWVAEAPAACTPTGRCTVLPLANFGGVTFVVTKAAAAGHAGTISDPAWSATAITLGDPNSGTTNATPTPLSPDGSSFGVTWTQSQPTP